MRPDQIPVEIEPEQAHLPPAAIARLFGRGYRLRGSERLAVYQAGRLITTVALYSTHEEALLLDPRSYHRLHSELPVRLRGPEGVHTVSHLMLLPRTLYIPERLQKTWGLSGNTLPGVQVGSVIFTGVTIRHDDRLRFTLCETDVLATRVEGKLMATLLRTVESPPAAPTCPSPSEAPLPRLITETDIRKARMEHRTIRLQPGQIITPSARLLGKELGVLED